MSTVSFEQMAQLLAEVFNRIHGNPPGWQDQRGFQGDPGSKAAITGPKAPDGDPGLTAPAVGQAPPLPGGEGDQYQPRNYAYGHMASVLTPEQAAAFRTLMFLQGHTGDTVGRGHVVPIDSSYRVDGGRGYQYYTPTGPHALTRDQMDGQDSPNLQGDELTEPNVEKKLQQREEIARVEGEIQHRDLGNAPTGDRQAGKSRAQ